MKSFDYKTALIIVVLIFIGALVLCSCHKEPEGRETYVIHEGKHYSNGNKTIKVPDTPFLVWIDYMWWYDDRLEDAFWNKLIGFSEDTHHHKNSVRIAWRSTDKEIRFALYAYVDEERVIKEFPTRYTLEQTVEMHLYREGDKYIGRVQDETLEIDSPDNDYTYTLFPYFGGNEPAPHIMWFVFDF